MEVIYAPLLWSHELIVKRMFWQIELHVFNEHMGLLNSVLIDNDVIGVIYVQTGSTWNVKS